MAMKTAAANALHKSHDPGARAPRRHVTANGIGEEEFCEKRNLITVLYPVGE